MRLHLQLTHLASAENAILNGIGATCTLTTSKERVNGLTSDEHRRCHGALTRGCDVAV